MAASDGGHVWPPRASDPRIIELTGSAAATPDDVFAALRTEGYTGSLDDMWRAHLAVIPITDTSEPFTGYIAIDPGLGTDDLLINDTTDHYLIDDTNNDAKLIND